MSASDQSNLCKPGPKTPVGRRRSSRNSRSHGLFSRELIFTEDEAAQFRAMRNRLKKDEPPSSAIEEILFDNLAVCAWRLSRAVRLEQIELERELKRQPDASIETLPADSSSDRLVGLGILETRRRFKLLQELRSDVESHGGASPEFEKPVTQMFGAEVWRSVTEWTAMGWPVWLGAAEFFATRGSAFPVTAAELAVEEKYKGVEANLRYQMILKLIDMEAQHLLRTGRELEARVVARERQGERFDLLVRYESKVRRDFYRAFAEYLAAKNQVSGGQE